MSKRLLSNHLPAQEAHHATGSSAARRYRFRSWKATDRIRTDDLALTKRWLRRLSRKPTEPQYVVPLSVYHPWLSNHHIKARLGRFPPRYSSESQWFPTTCWAHLNWRIVLCDNKTFRGLPYYQLCYTYYDLTDDYSRGAWSISPLKTEPRHR